MSFDIILNNFVYNTPYIPKENITSFSFKRKRTGEQIALVSTSDGRTLIKTLSLNGVIETKFIEIPMNFYNDKSIRDDIILEFLDKGYTQDDISCFTGVSQSLISAIKIKYRGKN